MAKLFILSEEHIKTGKRPKTPRQKMKMWRNICIILSILFMVEHAALLYYWIK